MSFSPLSPHAPYAPAIIHRRGADGWVTASSIRDAPVRRGRVPGSQAPGPSVRSSLRRVEIGLCREKAGASDRKWVKATGSWAVWGRFGNSHSVQRLGEAESQERRGKKQEVYMRRFCRRSNLTYFSDLYKKCKTTISFKNHL